MTIPNNDDRANWAQTAVSAFQAATGADNEDAIADLIANLCHLATRYGQDSLEQVRRGLIMYADERDYPDDGWAPDNQMASVSIDITRGTL
jgi:thioesterase domain-containing protein